MRSMILRQALNWLKMIMIFVTYELTSKISLPYLVDILQSRREQTERNCLLQSKNYIASCTYARVNTTLI